MTSGGVIVCAVLLAACGRIGFDGTEEVPPNGGDGGLLDCTTTYPNAISCTGFEESGMNGWDYTVIEEGSVALSTTRAYRGVQSLEIKSGEEVQVGFRGGGLYGRRSRWGRVGPLGSMTRA